MLLRKAKFKSAPTLCRRHNIILYMNWQTEVFYKNSVGYFAIHLIDTFIKVNVNHVYTKIHFEGFNTIFERLFPMQCQ